MTRRFGMVHVDFDTQKRTPKQSFHTYRDIIARHRRLRPRERPAGRIAPASVSG